MDGGAALLRRWYSLNVAGLLSFDKKKTIVYTTQAVVNDTDAQSPS
jgi:hypothetical protein